MEEDIPEVIANTIRKDITKSEQEALEQIYRQLRSGDAPDLDTARAYWSGSSSMLSGTTSGT